MTDINLFSQMEFFKRIVYHCKISSVMNNTMRFKIWILMGHSFIPMTFAKFLFKSVLFILMRFRGSSAEASITILKYHEQAFLNKSFKLSIT